MMFQLFVDMMSERGYQIRVIDSAERHTRRPRTDGRFSLQRSMDYLGIVPRFFLYLLTGRRIIYLTTAQSWFGFLRDALLIWPACIFGHRVILHQFGGNYDQFIGSRGTLGRAFVRCTLNRAHAVVVEGEEMRQHFAFLHGWDKKVHAIANGLPERAISPSIAPKVYDASEPFRLLFLSNMLETKGYWDVLEAVRILVRERKRNVTCRFVGQWLTATDCMRFSTPESARVAFGAYVDEHHLGGTVTHEAPLLGASKLGAFMEANAFLLPSNYINEGQPVSILEAMAYGLVVIACRYRLIPTMVANEHTGFLVEYGSPAQIADRIEFLIDNPDLYHQMSINAIKRFGEHFTADSYVDRVVNVIRAVSA